MGTLDAQKTVSNSLLFRYDVYPEIDGYESTSYYKMEAYDQFGIRYTVDENKLNRPQTTDIYFSKPLIKSMSLSNSLHPVTIHVQRVAHENVKKFEEKFKAQIENGSYQDRFVYKVTAEDKFLVRFIDNKDNKVIKEFTKDVNTVVYWPNEPIGNNGFTSQKDLQVFYASHHRLDTKTDSMLNKKFNAQILQGGIVSLSPHLEGIIGNYFVNINFEIGVVKSKDSKYEPLKEAYSRLTQLRKPLFKNSLNGIKGNFFVPEIRDEILKVNSIYEEFIKEEYLNSFTDENERTNYHAYMLSNYCLTSFMLGNYEKAIELYNTCIGLHNSLVKSGDSKNTSYLKATERLKVIESYIFREHRLIETFAKRYGFQVN